MTKRVFWAAALCGAALTISIRAQEGGVKRWWEAPRAAERAADSQVVKGTFTPRRLRAGLDVSFRDSDTSLSFDDPSSAEDSLSEESFDLDLGVGWRLSRTAPVQVEIGGGVRWSRAVRSPLADSRTFTIGPQVRVYFNARNRVQPWVQAQLGIVEEEGAGVDGEGIAAGFGVGVTFFVAERVAFDVGLRRTYYDLDYDYEGSFSTITGDGDTDVTSFAVGISTFF